MFKKRNGFGMKTLILLMVAVLVCGGFTNTFGQGGHVYAAEDGQTASESAASEGETDGTSNEDPHSTEDGSSADEQSSDEQTDTDASSSSASEEESSETSSSSDEQKGTDETPAAEEQKENSGDQTAEESKEAVEDPSDKNEDASAEDKKADEKTTASKTVTKKKATSTKKAANGALRSDSGITTWDELEAAINAGQTNITIGADLYADSTITIPNTVTLKGKDGGVTIYQAKRDTGKYDTMFKVSEGGDLTLGANLTLTGETGCASGGGDDGGDDDPIQTTRLQVVDDDPFFYYIGIYPKGSNNIAEEEKNKAVSVEVYDDRTIKYDGKYLGRVTKDGVQVYAFDSSVTAENAVKLTNLAGGDGSAGQQVIPLVEGDRYRLIDGTAGYLGMKDGLISPVSLTNAYEVTAIDVEDYSGSGSGGSGGDQGCDNECGTYTEANFDSGKSIDEPKGFFVQVEQGAKATLNGATLKNFITSRDKGTTPKFVAPVAVVGGTFNIESGNITNNIVGYIVDDRKAYENANAIKMYVKGAAPNAVRASGERRNKQAGIDAGGDAGSGITATAGAVIYAGGATGTVSGGTISLNRGDTGGIMATGANTKVTLAGGININNNVGVQFGGGTTTENGAWILMTGGTIKENVAWFGGGAVYSTENGVNWLLGKQAKGDRQDGWFTMDGGLIEGNTAFTRGGAILADSDGVSLIKGTFKNNMARMLGGAIYVMGDHPDYTYTVYIAKGYVHDNKAVSAGTKTTVATDPDNQILSRKLVAPNGCEPVTTLFNGQMEVNSDDIADGYPPNQKDSTDGTGGGVWLCSYGNTTLDLSDESEFYINENTATGSVRHQPISGPGKGGDDLHKDTKNNGSLVITGIDNDDNWVDQNSGEKYTSSSDGTNSVKDTAMRNLRNDGTTAGKDMPASYDPANYDGVDFYGNLSRRGGALAADGSFVFGKTQNIAQLFAEMSIEKAWTEGTEKEPIVLKVFVETADDKVEFAEVRLSEGGTPASELDVVFDEGNYKGRLMLPAFVEKRDDNDEVVEMIPVFDIKVDGSVIDLNSVDDLEALATAIQDNPDSVEFTSEGRKITFEEYIEVDGELVKTDKFQLSPAKISLDELDATVKVVKQKQTSGDEIPVVTASFPELKFNANVTNDKPAEIEKFVNEAVHKNIALDEVFTYDIVAYVKQDADKLVITDTLVDDLDFVSADTEVKLYDLGKENNHKPTNDASGAHINDDATVSGGEPIENAEVVVEGQVLKKVEIDGQTLTVTLANLLEFDDDGNYQKNADDNQLLTPLRGHWVRVSFQAQIKQTIQDEINAGTMSLDELQNVEISAEDVYKPDDSIYGKDENRPTPNVGNKPVESDEDHDGIINTASYAISVANEATYKDESNTVTVKPEEPELEKYVNQAVHKDITVDEVFTYDIIGYITKDADKVIFEDELESCLELINVDQIKVVSLDENNHKPTNDINGNEINDDASVAEEGGNIKDKDGVTVDAEDNGGKLKVTIDDEVTVNDKGAVIKREHFTVRDLRGKYVKITFRAQIKKELQDKINAGEMSIEDLLEAGVDVKENDPVLSDEEHFGIQNDAKMEIFVGNDSKYNVESNVVTVKPEGPEIEKYVNQAVHKDIAVDEVFTYDIIAYITKDADKFEITDELIEDLEFVSTEDDVEVVDLGTTNNHKPVNDVSGEVIPDSDDATVAQSGEAIENAKVDIEDNKLTVSMDDEVKPDTGERKAEGVKALRGHWVKVTFKAQIKKELQDRINAGEKAEDVLTYVEIKKDEIFKAENSIFEEGDRPAPNKGNDPVKSDEGHNGVANTASYTIGVTNKDGYKDESNTVTVKPEKPDEPEGPEIEKFIEQAVHKGIDINDVFTYDIVAYVTKDAEKVVITDELHKDLVFESTKDKVEVADLGEANNHKVTNNVKAEKVNNDATVAMKDAKAVDGAKVKIKGRKLTVEIKDATALRGHWVRVRFQCKVQKDKSLADVEPNYVTVKPDEVYKDAVSGGKRAEPNIGNAPVQSDEEHKGLPNTASYEIEVEGKVRYEDTSNTVTVNPSENTEVNPDKDNPDDEEEEEEDKKTTPTPTKTPTPTPTKTTLKSTAAKTGDMNNLMLWMGLMALAAAGMVITGRYSKKRK